MHRSQAVNTKTSHYVMYYIYIMYTLLTPLSNPIITTSFHAVCLRKFAMHYPYIIFFQRNTWIVICIPIIIWFGFLFLQITTIYFNHINIKCIDIFCSASERIIKFLITSISSLYIHRCKDLRWLSISSINFTYRNFIHFEMILLV